jgi:hypothetical protein
MSQYPPGGSQGYPPNFPPGGPQGFAPQGYSLPPATRTSAAAITSLVCGLILCIPFVTGLVAVITGIVGIAVTGNPAVRGRGMAVAGLILGILNICGYCGGVGTFVHYSQPARVFAHQYVSDLYAEKVDQCLQHSTSNLTGDQLDAAHKKMQTWGTLQDTTVWGVNFTNTNGNYNVVVTGIGTFTGGPHAFQMTLVKDAGGYKADSFAWQN